MERFFCAALIGAAFFAIGSPAHAEDAGGKHHKVQEWLSLLSEADRAKITRCETAGPKRCCRSSGKSAVQTGRG